MIIFAGGSANPTWQMELISDASETQRNPISGDTLTLILDKPFTSEDIFDLTMPDDFVITTVQASNVLPKTVMLKQLYPNPFNPTTTIEYHVAAPGLRHFIRLYYARFRSVPLVAGTISF